jgi:hypothetical protein
MKRGNALLAAVVAAATLAAATAAAQDAADKWQSVAKTDNQEAFVNAQSIVAAGGLLEAKVKQNFAAPQPAAKEGRTYLSTRTVYRFDCAQRRVAMKEIRAFPGADLQGEAVQKASRSDKNLLWEDAPERTVFGELLDYVCKAGGG